MTMLGTGVYIAPSVALSDALSLLKLIQDPEAHKAHLDQLAAAQDKLVAQAADLEARERALAEVQAELATARQKLAEELVQADRVKAGVQGLREFIENSAGRER